MKNMKFIYSCWSWTDYFTSLKFPMPCQEREGKGDQRISKSGRSSVFIIIVLKHQTGKHIKQSAKSTLRL